MWTDELKVNKEIEIEIENWNWVSAANILNKTSCTKYLMHSIRNIQTFYDHDAIYDT